MAKVSFSDGGSLAGIWASESEALSQLPAARTHIKRYRRCTENEVRNIVIKSLKEYDIKYSSNQVDALMIEADEKFFLKLLKNTFPFLDLSGRKMAQLARSISVRTHNPMVLDPNGNIYRREC